MKASAVIVAGGKGLRMKSKTRKQYLSLAEKPVLAFTIMAFDKCEHVREIILVVPENDLDFCQNNILSLLSLNTKIRIVPGGTQRQDSVYNGLCAVNESIVAIHDGVRPFIAPDLISSTIIHAAETGACIPGIQAFDTLKKLDKNNCIDHTLERESIWLAQTPQTFEYSLILEAHKQARKENFIGTDDASLIERMGKEVKVIPGTRLNIKITSPEDMILAQAIHKAMSNS